MADTRSRRAHRPPALVLALLLLAAAAAAPVCRADIQTDKNECMSQLMELQPCLMYVSKQGPKPTADCCESLRKVAGKSLRCLCILIKDKDDPAVKSFNIDLNRALSLPSACAINATTSDCPKLLNLAPTSPEAKLFQDVEGKLHGNSTGSAANLGSATATPSASGAVRRHSYGGWLLGGGLWASSSVAASLLFAVLNAHGV